MKIGFSRFPYSKFLAPIVIGGAMVLAAPAMAGLPADAGKLAQPTTIFGGTGGASNSDPFDMRNVGRPMPGEDGLSTLGDDQTQDNSDSFSVRGEAEGNVGYNLMVTKKLLKF